MVSKGLEHVVGSLIVAAVVVDIEGVLPLGFSVFHGIVVVAAQSGPELKVAGGQPLVYLLQELLVVGLLLQLLHGGTDAATVQLQLVVIIFVHGLHQGVAECVQLVNRLAILQCFKDVDNHIVEGSKLADTAVPFDMLLQFL